MLCEYYLWGITVEGMMIRGMVLREVFYLRDRHSWLKGRGPQCFLVFTAIYWILPRTFADPTFTP